MDVSTALLDPSLGYEVGRMKNVIEGTRIFSSDGQEERFGNVRVRPGVPGFIIPFLWNDSLAEKTRGAITQQDKLQKN